MLLGTENIISCPKCHGVSFTEICTVTALKIDSEAFLKRDVSTPVPAQKRTYHYVCSNCGLKLDNLLKLDKSLKESMR